MARKNVEFWPLSSKFATKIKSSSEIRFKNRANRITGISRFKSLLRKLELPYYCKPFQIEIRSSKLLGRVPVFLASKASNKFSTANKSNKTIIQFKIITGQAWQPQQQAKNPQIKIAKLKRVWILPKSSKTAP